MATETLNLILSRFVFLVVTH